MKTKPKEKPKSLGRYLMESKRQTQEELKEMARTNPRIQKIYEDLERKNGN